MSSYAKETREYARKILILAKTKDEEELYSLNKGWLGTKQEMDRLANLFLKTADDLTYKVSQPVENHLKETQKIKRKVYIYYNEGPSTTHIEIFKGKRNRT